MSKYGKLDAEILGKIHGYPKRFISIYAGDVEAECIRISAAEGKGSENAFRMCDRRLQALRKSGKIKASSSGWTRVES